MNYIIKVTGFLKFFLIVLFFSTNTFGQNFSMPELIKMSKMDTDTFDTYVTSRGFVFFEEENKKNVEGVSYALNISRIDKSKASKFITLYQIYYDSRYSISYQTSNRQEYLNIKSQIKNLGFRLENSKVFNGEIKNGSSANHFEYKKGKATIDLYAGSTNFEIDFELNF